MDRDPAPVGPTTTLVEPAAAEIESRDSDALIEPDATSGTRQYGLRLLIVACLLIPGLIQMLGGFGEAPQLEEWGIFDLFDRTGPLFFVSPDSPIGSQAATRPLTVLPHALAWVIDSDGFAGYHIMQAVGLTLQAVGVFLLCRELRLGRQIALTAALVFALFPAWTGLFVFRTIHFHLAAGFVAIGAWLLMRSRERLRPVELVLMSVLLCAGLMAYEGYYSVVVFLPLLLLVAPLAGRRRIVLTAIWFVGPFVNGLHFLWVLHTGRRQYQEVALIHRSRTRFEAVDLFGRIFSGAVRGFVTPPFGFAVTALGVIGVTVVIVTLLLIASRPDTTSDVESMSWRRLALGGLVATLIAPLMAFVYWSSTAWLSDPLRIFSVASFALSLAIALALGALRDPRLRTVLCVLLVATSMFSAVAQRDHWRAISRFQEHVLGEAADELAQRGSPEILVIYDPELQLGGVYSFIDDVLDSALSYLLEQPRLHVTICHMAPEEATGIATGTACALTDSSVTISNGSTFPIDATLVAVLRDGVLDTVDGARPDAVPLGQRVVHALECLREETCEPIPPSPDPWTAE